MTGSLDRSGYELVREDSFDGDRLDESLWYPYHLPQWSSREQAGARWRLADGELRLVVEEDQPPWCPELDGTTRVSSLQTGVRSGPVGSTVGQHRFTDRAVVREEQPTRRLLTPTYGLIEMRARAEIDAHAMVALWMIGDEDEPEHSAEICVAEIFGRGVTDDSIGVGMGVHPFGDAAITDDFEVVTLPLDLRDFHEYAAEWTADRVDFFVDGSRVRTVPQAPGYPMQLMLGVYEFPTEDGPARPGTYPQTFVVDWVGVWQRPSATGSR